MSRYLVLSQTIRSRLHQILSLQEHWAYQLLKGYFVQSMLLRMLVVYSFTLRAIVHNPNFSKTLLSIKRGNSRIIELDSIYFKGSLQFDNLFYNCTCSTHSFKIHSPQTFDHTVVLFSNRIGNHILSSCFSAHLPLSRTFCFHTSYMDTHHDRLFSEFFGSLCFCCRDLAIENHDNEYSFIRQNFWPLPLVFRLNCLRSQSQVSFEALQLMNNPLFCIRNCCSLDYKVFYLVHNQKGPRMEYNSKLQSDASSQKDQTVFQDFLSRYIYYGLKSNRFY